MAYRVIGGSQARADAWEKVRGRPIYAGDLALAGMLHGRIVRSPYASARIVRLDTEAARVAGRDRGTHRAGRAAQRAPHGIARPHG
jgi:CO/xanthine dehydrogenase Mo-binding subunit